MRFVESALRSPTVILLWSNDRRDERKMKLESVAWNSNSCSSAFHNRRVKFNMCFTMIPLVWTNWTHRFNEVGISTDRWNRYSYWLSISTVFVSSRSTQLSLKMTRWIRCITGYFVHCRKQIPASSLQRQLRSCRSHNFWELRNSKRDSKRSSKIWRPGLKEHEPGIFKF